MSVPKRKASFHTTDIVGPVQRLPPTVSFLPPALALALNVNQSQNKVSVISRESDLTSNPLPVALIQIAPTPEHDEVMSSHASTRVRELPSERTCLEAPWNH